MIESVLIANRGEIACRVIKTARTMGLRTIAVYSDADANALHVRLADEAWHLGPAPAAQSYLDVQKVLSVAQQSGAHAIHPGYGFLSENAAFAEACEAQGIVFVGPSADAIRAMGLKDRAKTLMDQAGVPVVPGYHGSNQDVVFLQQQARSIGYPVLIKAVSGGGGKGMRLVERDEDFVTALESAQREGLNAFGDANVLIERFVKNPRHIEIQVFADSHGNAVHLHERDCSLQRRHQKVIEEAPAPGMTDNVRAAMGQAAVKAALAVGYRGAGTVEFIVDGSSGLREDGFFFMEMNTRLQVEHPVTEAITGQDLVAWQFDVANGKPLPLAQDAIPLFGHAVEARLYAEDPENGFLPSTGKLLGLSFHAGEGVRIDTGVEAGDVISPHYDPMIAKVIVHGATRAVALSKLADVLRHSVVAGPKSNAAFLATLVQHPDFVSENFDTGFIDARLDALIAPDHNMQTLVGAVALQTLLSARQRSAYAMRQLRSNERSSAWDAIDGFQLGRGRTQYLPIVVDGIEQMHSVQFGVAGLMVEGAKTTDQVSIIENADGLLLMANGRQYRAHLPDYDHEEEGGSGQIGAPMHGKVIAVFVQEGQSVAKGDRLFIVEAMKMEHSVVAPTDGVVSKVSAKQGDQVGEGFAVVSLHDEAEAAA
ncbi:acetyl/propionyl/methylcrotonyl-CoA carboxylase subunit alpha [Cohaesibacter celericrescens]|uniref:acetyl/propionyl/methylcrotonyl-CoA carboxylase subunit alpha n=1 Tax=Cohaesibacter celericrescens TaxID=2067669 RepID=UPI00356146EE